MRIAGPLLLALSFLSHPASAPVRHVEVRSLAPQTGTVPPAQGGAGTRGDACRSLSRPPLPAGETVAIINGRVLPVSGPAVDRGVVLIVNGKISAVGSNVVVPPGARVIDATGKVVTPGWLDSATQLGVVEIPSSAEGTADQTTSDPGLSAAFNVVDSFNGDTTLIPVTRVEGITRAVVMPIGTHVLIGQGAVIDLSGAQAPAAIVKSPVGDVRAAWRGRRRRGGRVAVVGDVAAA